MRPVNSDRDVIRICNENETATSSLIVIDDGSSDIDTPGFAVARSDSNAPRSMSHRGHREPMNRKIKALAEERNAAGNHDPRIDDRWRIMIARSKSDSYFHDNRIGTFKGIFPDSVRFKNKEDSESLAKW